MSAISNIVVFDGAAPPVAHTFLAESVSREGQSVTATYREAIAGVPDYAQGRVTIKHTRLGSGVSKRSVRVELSVMESVSGANASGYTAAPKVAYVDTVEVNGLFHERSQVAGRRSVRQLALNIVGNIATSVIPVQTGPVPELFDLSVAPT